MVATELPGGLRSQHLAAEAVRVHGRLLLRVPLRVGLLQLLIAGRRAVACHSEAAAVAVAVRPLILAGGARTDLVLSRRGDGLVLRRSLRRRVAAAVERLAEAAIGRVLRSLKALQVVVVGDELHAALLGPGALRGGGRARGLRFGATHHRRRRVEVCFRRHPLLVSHLVADMIRPQLTRHQVLVACLRLEAARRNFQANDAWSVAQRALIRAVSSVQVLLARLLQLLLMVI